LARPRAPCPRRSGSAGARASANPRPRARGRPDEGLARLRELVTVTAAVGNGTALDDPVCSSNRSRWLSSVREMPGRPARISLKVRSLYPTQAAALDQAYQASLAKVPDGAAKTHGVMVGKRQTSAARAPRRSITPPTPVAYAPEAARAPGSPHHPRSGPRSTPAGDTSRRFCFAPGSQFRPGPPPALTSSTYARDFDESMQVGSQPSTTRTLNQTNLARFWVSTAPQIWNQAAQQLAVSHGLGVSRAAEAVRVPKRGRAQMPSSAPGREVHVRPMASGHRDPRGGHRRQRSHGSRSRLDAAPADAAVPRLPGRTHHIRRRAETILSSVLGTRPGTFTLRSATAPGVELTYTASPPSPPTSSIAASGAASLLVSRLLVSSVAAEHPSGQPSPQWRAPVDSPSCVPIATRVSTRRLLARAPARRTWHRSLRGGRRVAIARQGAPRVISCGMRVLRARTRRSGPDVRPSARVRQWMPPQTRALTTSAATAAKLV